MKPRKSLLKDNSGAGAVAVIVLLVVFFGLLAVVIDLGRLLLVKNQLQNAGDDCALAGARAFAPYELPVAGYIKIDATTWGLQMRASGITAASTDISDNRSDTRQLTTLPTGDIQTGTWDANNPTPPDQPLLPWIDWSDWSSYSTYMGRHVGPAIRLPVQKTGSYNYGPVSMTLASIFNIQAVSVHTHATAWLAPWGGPNPNTGNITMPFGSWLDDLPTKLIHFGPDLYLHGTFAPDPNNTLGWTDLQPNGSKTNANLVKKILEGTTIPDCESPANLSIQNGVISSAIQTMTAMNGTKLDNRFGLVPSTFSGVVNDPVPGQLGLSVTPGNLYEPLNTQNPAQPPGTTYADTIYMMPEFYNGTNYPQYNQSGLASGTPVYIAGVAGPPDNFIDLRIVQGTVILPGYPGTTFTGSLSTTPQLVGGYNASNY
jgi:Putative Flp pilus-assembly TadE/G-like